MDAISDKSVLRHVNQRLSRLGGSQGKVSASVARGTVTLTGTIQYEMQRASIVKVATSVPGVRSISDQLKLKPKVREVYPTRPITPKVAVPKPVAEPAAAVSAENVAVPLRRDEA